MLSLIVHEVLLIIIIIIITHWLLEHNVAMFSELSFLCCTLAEKAKQRLYYE